MEREVDDTHPPRKEKKCQNFSESIFHFLTSIRTDVSELFTLCFYQFRNIYSTN